jgi:hypothetical protein
MLPFLNPPLPNENIYCTLGRQVLCTLMHDSSIKKFYLGGNTSIFISNQLPTSLNKIAEAGKLLENFSAALILENHTIWNYIFRFLSRDQIEGYKKLIYSDSRIILKKKKSLYNMVLSLPKYCPCCNEVSLEEHRQMYFHVCHQIPGILVCPDHGCFLEEGNINQNKNVKDSKSIILPSDEYFHIKIPRPNTSKLNFEVAKNMKAILDGTYTINLDYKERLIELGLTTGNRINVLELVERMEKFFGEKVIKDYGLRLFRFEKNLSVYPYFKLSPTEHILFDIYLNQETRRPDARKYLAKFWDRHFFGNGPWPCHDSNCKSLSTEAVFRYDRTQRLTVGNFKCKCGSRYTKSFRIADDRITKTLITVRKSNVWKLKTSKSKFGKIELKEKRKLLKNLISIVSPNSHYDLKKKLDTLRKWFRKNDGQWYFKNQVAFKKSKKKQFEERLKANEQVYLTRLKEAYDKVVKQNPTQRIRPTTVLRISKLRGIKVTASIAKFLNSITESSSDYTKRRNSYPKVN